ncbi:Cilia- and flagella-associated protein 70 [Physocladia obscura]|uniref:Cilia- and flagella-associated protein 70 n=1 Tax=Physocladia obscura TaxID=109957 RepID=A0AAD5XLA2_9FUNG|nr:Cilia- and flagella-associated protein 70 [Physocladia obscura]
MPGNLLHQKRAEKADEGFRDQIHQIVKNLVYEYQGAMRGIVENAAATVTTEAGNTANYITEFNDFDIVHPKALEDEQKRKKSGAYFNLKEQLKSSVVNVVRERYRKKSAFSSQTELQLFLSELYVYLLDQMHVSIHTIFKNVDSAFIDPTVLRTADLVMLKKFADQSELDNEISIAATYHQERIAKYEDCLQTWQVGIQIFIILCFLQKYKFRFDYGTFCMRNMQSSKGVECFKEILSRNSKHVPSLLAYGSICTSTERYEEARVCLVTAVELQPKYVLAQTILGLFYEITGEDVESERILEEATQLYRNSNANESFGEENTALGGMMLKASEFLVAVHAMQIADCALSNSLLKMGHSVAPYLLLAQLEIQRGDPIVAVENIKSAMQVRQDDPNVWAALGHLQFKQRVWGEAQNSYETVLSLPHDPTNLPLIYIRLGFLYLRTLGCITKKVIERTYSEIELAKKAKTMYIRACEIEPSSSSWLGVAKASIMLGQFDEAEDSLSVSI